MSPHKAAWGGESKTRRLNVSSCPPHLVEGGPLGAKDLISGGLSFTFCEMGTITATAKFFKY